MAKFTFQELLALLYYKFGTQFINDIIEFAKDYSKGLESSTAAPDERRKTAIEAIKKHAEVLESVEPVSSQLAAVFLELALATVRLEKLHLDAISTTLEELEAQVRSNPLL